MWGSDGGFLFPAFLELWWRVEMKVGGDEMMCEESDIGFFFSLSYLQLQPPFTATNGMPNQ